MAVELKVPAVGESITEVLIAEWLKQEGEDVRLDESIAVLETDKATVELPSPNSGKLAKILKGKGETAQVGEVIGYVEVGEGATSSVQPTAAPAATQPSKPQPEVRSVAEKDNSAPKQASVTPLEPMAKSSEAKQGKEATPSAEPQVMPAAQRVLDEYGIKAEDVHGTGPGGRVLKEDVLRHVDRSRELLEPQFPVSAGISDDDKSDTRQEEIVPMSPLRRRVAERLVEAQRNAALLTTFNEIDMSACMAMRKRYQDAFQKKYQVKLGFMSFFLKAVIESLKEIPQLNAEIRGTDVVYRNYYDIGVAVGSGKGLVVPILRSAERMSFAQLELAIQDFGKRAQENRLKLDELIGGTFTISNGGVYGSLLSTPIVNPPQSGVLGMHAIQERPVALDGQVVIRPMMYVALSYDHRIVDGREAVTFLKRVKELIEDPARLILEI